MANYISSLKSDTIKYSNKVGTILFIVILTLPGCNQNRKVKDINRVPVSTEAISRPDLPSTSIHEAALNGQVNVVSAHLERGTDVNLLDDEGRTALMYAAYNGHTEVLKKLTEKGCNVNLQDPYGRTALMMAASGPFDQSVKILLDKGADPNLIDKEEHFTALMYAAAEGQLEVVRILLAYKADPSMKDIDGDQAEKFAAANNHSEVASLLRSFKGQ